MIQYKYNNIGAIIDNIPRLFHPARYLLRHQCIWVFTITVCKRGWWALHKTPPPPQLAGGTPYASHSIQLITIYELLKNIYYEIFFTLQSCDVYWHYIRYVLSCIISRGTTNTHSLHACDELLLLLLCYSGT